MKLKDSKFLIFLKYLFIRNLNLTTVYHKLNKINNLFIFLNGLLKKNIFLLQVAVKQGNQQLLIRDLCLISILFKVFKLKIYSFKRSFNQQIVFCSKSHFIFKVSKEHYSIKTHKLLINSLLVNSTIILMYFYIIKKHNIKYSGLKIIVKII
jgi:hypothetical protein